MKRTLATLLALLAAIPLTVGLLAGVSYYTLGNGNMPSPTLVVMGQQLEPLGHDWQEPLFGGAMYKQLLRRPEESKAPYVGRMDTTALQVTAPEGFTCTASLYHKDALVWSGRAADIGKYSLVENGRYTLQVVCEKPQEERKSYGSFTFGATLDIAMEPTLEMGDTWVYQGDVLALRLTRVDEDTRATASCGFGDFPFYPTGRMGEMMALIPIACDREAGDYPVTVKAGQYLWEFSIRAIAFSFPISEGAWPQLDTAAAQTQVAQLRDLYTLDDSSRRWRGTFQSPLPGGKITRDYGVMQYVELRPTGALSQGIAITARAGADVAAAADGRVAYAGVLDDGSCAVVIDHGGGLRSIYLHLAQLQVETDAQVEAGQLLGALGGHDVGSASLYFETRIGQDSISPAMVLNASSGMYLYD